MITLEDLETDIMKEAEIKDFNAIYDYQKNIVSDIHKIPLGSLIYIERNNGIIVQGVLTSIIDNNIVRFIIINDNESIMADVYFYTKDKKLSKVGNGVDPEDLIEELPDGAVLWITVHGKKEPLINESYIDPNGLYILMRSFDDFKDEYEEHEGEIHEDADSNENELDPDTELISDSTEFVLVPVTRLSSYLDIYGDSISAALELNEIYTE